MSYIANPFCLKPDLAKQYFLKFLPEIVNNRVYTGISTQTPLQPAENLSLRHSCNIHIKREDLQSVFSFKSRGAHNFIHNKLTKETKGVICSSAGNHAQGVTASAVSLGIPATIVMPTSTPDIKINAVKRLGGKVILFGERYDEAAQYAKELAQQQNLMMVHPFDDDLVIWGQATIAMEIVNQATFPIDIVFVPIGGGGLISGIATYIKAVSPETKIIGVEPLDSNCATAAIQNGKPTLLTEVGLFVDGVSVKQVGTKNWSYIKRGVDGIVNVSIDEICSAVKDVFEDFRVIAEPAGALAVAGIAKYLQHFPAQKKLNIIALLSGANTNFTRLGHIVERAEMGAGEERLLLVKIPDKTGSFLKLLDGLEDNIITEFNYRFNGSADAKVLVGVKLAGGHKVENFNVMKNNLLASDFGVFDLSDDEMTKSHLRHMIGGQLNGNLTEQVYSLTLRASNQTLKRLLEAISHKYNISLFHFRDHGAAFHRILIGFSESKMARKDIETIFNALQYEWSLENDNPAYADFLR